jgi:hypothetical protein
MQRAKQFTIVVPNERYRRARMLHIFFLVLFSLALVYVSIMSQKWRGIGWAVLALLSLLGLFKKPKATADAFTANVWEVGFFWLVAGWWNTEYYWITAMVFIVSILGITIRSAYKINVSKEAVLIQSFPKKKVKWFELNNLILKDELLTIDFKNDKLVQAEILPGESDFESEAEFNEFCSEQLLANRLAVKL